MPVNVNAMSRVLLALAAFAWCSTTETEALVVTRPCCHVFEHRGAMFGPELPVKPDAASIFSYIPDRPKISAVQGPLKLTDFSNPSLCHPEWVKHVTYDFQDAIALIPRGGCSFAEKVYFAQLLGAVGAVVFQPQVGEMRRTERDDVIVMAEDSRYGPLVTIPSAFVSFNSWKELQKLFEEVEVTDQLETDDSGEQARLLYAVLNETGGLASAGPEALPMMWDSLVFLVEVFLIIWSVMGFAYITNWIKVRYRRFQRQNVIRSLPCKKYRKLQFHSPDKSAKMERKVRKQEKTGTDTDKVKFHLLSGGNDKENSVDSGGYESANIIINRSNNDKESTERKEMITIDLEQNLQEHEGDQNVIHENEAFLSTLKNVMPLPRVNSELKSRNNSPSRKNRNSTELGRSKSFESYYEGSSNSSLNGSPKHSNVNNQAAGLSSDSENNSISNYECDSCVICLCEFDLEDFVTVLPCKHIYHKECIEPWLTNKSSLCPVCKQSVFKNGESRSINEINASENERENNGRRLNANHDDDEENGEQRRGSIALSVGMFLVIVLSFTFMMVDDDH